MLPVQWRMGLLPIDVNVAGGVTAVTVTAAEPVADA